MTGAAAELPIETVELAQPGELREELRPILRGRSRGFLWAQLRRCEKAAVIDRATDGTASEYRGAWVAEECGRELRRRRAQERRGKRETDGRLRRPRKAPRGRGGRLYPAARPAPSRP